MKRMLSTKSGKQFLITFCAVVAAFVVMQAIAMAGAMSSMLKGQLVPICAYVVMAISLNLTVGILGELSLGHAGFMSVGAFLGTTTAVALQGAVPSPTLRLLCALVVGAVFAGVVGFLVGIPVLRLNGDYLAIVTLAFGEVIKNIVRNLYIATDASGLHINFTAIGDMDLDPATRRIIVNGAMGVSGTPRDSKLWIAALLVLVTVVVVMNLVDSRAGRAFMSVRDNVIAAESVGVPVVRYKLLAFSVSAFFAGIAGVLYSHNLSSISPSTFDYNLSIMILVYVVLGGIGSIRGSIIAAALLYALPEMLRALNTYRMVIYAVILIAMMILNNNAKFKEKFSRFSPKTLLDRIKRKREGQA